jgi:PAS domain S-box-containing protein
LRIVNGHAWGHAYVAVQVRFTADYDAAGLLEHVLLWLEPVVTAVPTEAASNQHRTAAHGASHVAHAAPTERQHQPSQASVEKHHQRAADSADNSKILRKNSNNNTNINDIAKPKIDDSAGQDADVTPACDTLTNCDTLYVDAQPTVLFVLDSQWRFVQLNEAAAQLMNTTEAALLGQSLWQHFPNVQDNRLGALLQRAMQTREPVYYEVLADDEHLRFGWYGVHVLPAAELLVFKVEDITKRKYQQQQLEAARHHGEQLFEQRNAVLDAITDCVFIIDAQYRFTYVNQLGLELFEVSLEEVLGETLWDVLYFPAGSPFRQLYLDTITTNSPQRIRAQSLHPKLRGRTLDVKTTPFRGGLIAYSRDITELETLQADLASALADKEAVLDSITDAVTVLDREGVYLYANERVRRRVPGIIGQAYADLFPEHQVSIFETYYQRAFDSQEVVCFEAQTHQDKWMDVRVYPAGDHITVYATDFSEQKLLERALIASEAKFRNFFENNITPCTMFIFDPTDEWARGFHFNNAFADFLKDTAFADYADRLSSVEDTLQAFTAIGHPEDNTLDERFIAEVIAGKRNSYQLEKRYFTRDGGTIWGDISSVFLRDEAGDLSLGMSIVQDITDRKRAEQALRDSEAKFRAFFYDSTVPHFMISYINAERNTLRLDTNAAFNALFAGTVLADAPNEISVTAYGVLEAALHNQTRPPNPLAPSPQEKCYFNQDGSYFWCQVSSVSLHDDQGRSIACLSTLQDITERKRAEQALRESEAKFRNFFEHSSVPYTLTIHERNPYEDNFVYVYNNAFAQLVANTTFFDDFDPHSARSVVEAMRRATHPDDFAVQEVYLNNVAAKRNDRYHLEKRYLNRDGSILWVDVDTFVWSEQASNRLFVIGMLQDITERKRAQAALEKALADKEMLLKEVHHRTKNNMQLISSMLSIQSRRIVDDLAKQALVESSKRINLLASIHRALYQMPESGDIDAGEQLKYVLEGLSRGLRDIPLTIDSDIASVPLDVHQAIPLMLVANELLTNAFKHAFVTPKAGDRLRVYLTLEGEQVTLEVIDNGVGISEGAANQDSLGMVIIATLTSQLNAALTLENQPTGGTVARVTFVKHTAFT